MSTSSGPARRHARAALRPDASRRTRLCPRSCSPRCLAIAGAWSSATAHCGSVVPAGVPVAAGARPGRVSRRHAPSIRMRYRDRAARVAGPRASGGLRVPQRPSRRRHQFEYAPVVPAGFERQARTTADRSAARRSGARPGDAAAGAPRAAQHGRGSRAHSRPLRARVVGAQASAITRDHRWRPTPCGRRVAAERAHNRDAPRRAVGAGSELHQLRDYVPGRSVWRASTGRRPRAPARW